MKNILLLLALICGSIHAATVAEMLDDGIPVSASSITPTKGSLWVANGTAFIPVVIGANGRLLTADSSAASGVSWQAAGAGTGTVTSVATGNGLQGGTFTTSGTIDLRLDISGTLSKTLGAGTNELGIAALGVGTAQIAADAVTDAKLRDSAALSVIGNATNATANPADIAAASDHQVLRRSGTAIAFGQVNLAQSAAVTGALTAGNGGTGSTSTPSAGNIPVGNAGGTAYAPVAVSSDATLSSTGALTISNSAVTNAKMSNMADQTIKGNNTGGTAAPVDLSAAQATAMLNVFGADSGAGGVKGLVPATVSGDSAKFLKGNGTWAVTPAGTVTAVTGTSPISSSGGATPDISLNTAGVTYAKIQDVAALSLIGRSANTSGVSAEITASVTGHVLRYAGSTIGFGPLDLTDSDSVSGALPIVSGGTSGATATAGFNALSPVTTRGDLIVRGATDNQRLPVGAAARILQSDGTDPSWVTVSSDATIAAGGALTIANDAVTTAKILNANVTAAKLVNAGVFTGDATTTFPALTIGNDAITTAKILNANVTAAKMVNSGVFTGDATTTFPAITIGSAAITLAKMANLAQDQFIGRITASTGVPETATITAAARTVLDDTTVGAMVDTLGGASSTGTGGIARATSPLFVTPTLGVASSTSLATSAATPLLLTNGQLVNIALTSQTTGTTTLTIPDFASVVDEFTFKTKAQTMSNKTFVAPALGTPGSGVLTNCTGTASGLTAGTVTTNANLTGPVTSVGNATTIADAELSAIAGLTSAADKGIQFTGAGTAGTFDLTATAKTILDDASLQAIRTTLNVPTLDYVQIQDQKADGTDGGTATSGSYQTRVLNTEVADTGGLSSISSNQVTLAAGTWRCLIKCPAYGVSRHKAKLYNITDAADAIIGSCEFEPSGTCTSHSFIAGQFVIAGTKVFEVQHRVETTNGGDGFGVPCSFGDTEIYTDAQFWRIKE